MMQSTLVAGSQFFEENVTPPYTPNCLDIADDSEPILRMISEPINVEDIKSAEIQNFIKDMVVTMYAGEIHVPTSIRNTNL